ncbi:glycosyltransferase [Paenibacillus sp. FA6]|uniref:GAP1-N2 domain-containing protein n=1 Tax=Paenibacillus sp. FA6 TaxID=3413029 RepID=UPI003F65DDE3
MENTTPQLIQQQLYTRERRGIFRSTEGFDTIARSKGLDHSFIKKMLHPFCFYDAPAELSARGEKDTAMYPEALHLYHTDNDQTIIGRSVYQSADFTGLRSAFFTHNYVIPSERSEEVVANYASWLHADFVDTYDIEQGLDLPELNSLPIGVGINSSRTNTATLLASLNMDEKMFKQLLFAVMTAVTSKKKVYISLDVPAEQISMVAKQLLEVLYGSLPYAFRKALGFLTYSKEPQSKKGIHVMFVERASLRPGDRNVEKDFTFDLVAKRVTNVDVDLSKPSYFDFAWSNLDRPERAESFYQFAEVMLADMDHIRKTSISSYHELAVFFQIEEGNDVLFEDNKSTLLRGLLDYLSLPGAMLSKVRLNDIFLARFDQEFDLIKQGQVPDLAIVEAFKDYYRICGKNNEGKIVTYLMVAISHASSTKRKEVVTSFYKVIESNPELSKAFFDMVLSSGFSKALFEPYILEKFTQAPKAKDVMQLVGIWGKHHPIVTRDVYFVEQAKSQLFAKLRKESEPVTAVNALLEQQRKLEKDWEQQRQGQGAVIADFTLMDQLAYAANLFLLTELDLDRLTKDQLLKIKFLKERSEVKTWAAKFDTRIRSQAAVMLAVYAWFSDDQPDQSLFDGLSPMELDRVQQLGCQWLQDQIIPEQFGRLALAFYQSGQAGVNYSGLLNFIRRHGKDQEVVYQFIQWSASQRMFVGDRGLIPAYASAIISYFKNMDRDAFKKKDLVKKYFASPSPKLKPVYAKVEIELSTPFVKFLRRNRRQLAILSMFVGVMLIVLIGGFYGLKATGIFDKKPEVVLNPTPPAVVDPSPEVTPDVVVYAEQAEAIDGKVGEAQLVFLFKDAGTCVAFDASSMTLELADGTDPKILSELKPDVKCEAVVEPNANADAENKDKTNTSDVPAAGTETPIKDASGSKDSENVSGDSGEAMKDSGIVGKDSENAGKIPEDETLDGKTTPEDKGQEPGTVGKGEGVAGADTGAGTGNATGKETGAGTGPGDVGESGAGLGTEEQKPTPPINLADYKSSVTVKLPKVTMEMLVGSSIKVGTETFELSEKPKL